MKYFNKTLKETVKRLTLSKEILQELAEAFRTIGNDNLAQKLDLKARCISNDIYHLNTGWAKYVASQVAKSQALYVSNLKN